MVSGPLPMSPAPSLNCSQPYSVQMHPHGHSAAPDHIPLPWSRKTAPACNILVLHLLPLLPSAYSDITSLASPGVPFPHASSRWKVASSSTCLLSPA